MYKVYFSDGALCIYKKFDKQIQRNLKAWIVNNIENCIDPRLKGKALTGNLAGLWRYRVGQYRIIVEIIDKEFKILIIDLGHRKDI